MRVASKGRGLPAVATVAAIAAASAAAPAPAPAAIAAAPTTTAASAFSLRSGFVHDEVTASEVLAVQRIDRAIRILIIGYFNEGKSPGLSGETITNQINAGWRHTHLSEPLLNLFFRRGKWEITDIELLHLPLLLPGTQ